MGDGSIVLMQGARGTGKTLTLVALGCYFASKKWKVYSNFSFSFAQKVDNDFILSLDRNSTLRNCVILVDEMQILFDSRLWKSGSSITFSHFLQQIRKRNITIIGTTQYVDTVEKRIRQHVDLLIKPKYDFNSGWCFFRIYDLTSLEDLSFPKSIRGVFLASPLFSMYNTKEMI